ncbi:MAG: ABC transporter ATP-binding protein [Gemmatimonadetes bacterium]|nr:MAG: ABC transporter ATP-binding protein [Gemmatimonadota bacterium]
MRDAFVYTHQLNLVFDTGLHALRDVNLCLKKGEFVSIVGPSGCGKSTLLRLVAGLLEPTSGVLHVDGVTPLQARREKQEVAFVFQEANLLKWRTVRGNIRLPLELRGIPSKQATGQIDTVLNLVGLQDFADSLPRHLSGGMKMRVSLARALVTQPDLLLLDEPFGALDEITRQRLNEELLALWEHHRWTALFVTHNVFEAVFLSQRIVVMSSRPGSVVADICVPFDYPRSPELRSRGDFAALAGMVSRHLRGDL